MFKETGWGYNSIVSILVSILVCGWGHGQDVCCDSFNSMMMQDAVNDELDDLEKKEKDYSEKMESLKKILYARFGSSINLES